jgi:hypothetical protein
MGGGTPEKQTITTRYAPYLETAHQSLITVAGYAYAASCASPLDGLGSLDFDDSIATALSDFDTYMKSLDIDSIFDSAFSNTVYGPVVSSLITEEAGILSDDLANEVLPRFRSGMRDINSVMSTTFVIGEAMLEANRIKALSRFSADIRGKMMSVAVDRWKTILNWKKAVAEMSAQIVKMEISSMLDGDSTNADILTKHGMWRMYTLQYYSQALAALTGAQDTTSDVMGPSKAQKAIGGALAGAGIGAAVGGPVGAAVGAGIGALISLF